jgi:thioredoxin-like negative regulator of GroEL
VARWGALARRLYWPVVLGLIGWNAWRFWEDRPLPALKTVAAWMEAGREADAERALRAHLARSPQYGEARLMLARLLANRGDVLGCAGQLHEVPFWSPLKNDATFREAQSWLKADRARDAEAAFRRYLADDPNHPVAKPFLRVAEVELINLLSLENRWDETRAVIWQAVPRAEGADREELLVMSLRTLLERSSPAASVGTLRRYVAADPSDTEARLALAVAAQALGRPAESDGQMAVCLRQRPDDPKVWRARLEVLKDRGDLAALKDALAKAPATVADALWPYRGLVLAQSGDLPGAADAYARAVASQPHDADLHYRSALVARRLGRARDEARALQRYKALQAARADLPDALTKFVEEARAPDAPTDVRRTTAARLAEICKALGRDRDAREWARLATESRPLSGA